MAYDIQQNLNTGDWVFNSIHDYAGAEAENLIQQRIHVRLKVQRGSYMYDRSGRLGSRLESLIGLQIPQAKGGYEALIREALDPMTDIVVTDVSIHTADDGSAKVNDPRQILAIITYALKPVSDLSATISPQQTIAVTLTQ